MILDDIKKKPLHTKFLVQCTSCKREWEVTLANNYIPKCKNCSLSYIKVPKGHQEILDLIRKEIPTLEVIINDRKILNGDELDIVIPSKKLAIEFNGTYFHSEVLKGKEYHVSKTKKCMWKGYQLLHISGADWVDKKDILVSMLRSKLGVSKSSIYARKCTVEEISPKLKKEFLNGNHISGNCRSSINIGVFHEGQLYTVLTFGKPRYSSQHTFELIRSCTIKNINVIGGFSKALRYFTNTYNPTSIVSYADRNYSVGNVYIKNNFLFEGFTKPGYSYVKNNICYNREIFQKHKLKGLLPLYDEHLTEVENMKNNGFYRMYNTGNYRFVWQKKIPIL